MTIIIFDQLRVSLFLILIKKTENYPVVIINENIKRKLLVTVPAVVGAVSVFEYNTLFPVAAFTVIVYDFPLAYNGVML